ncbi:Carnitine O-acetyltransferase mitochondrial [Serendipita sp. 399]|nr:Carnitine O-acetyltransferase mitochondrial [Serendipita sp. 399]
MPFRRSNATYAGMLPLGLRPSEYTVPLANAPSNWKTLAPFPSNPSAETYSKQESLAHLPIPPLAATLEKLKSSLKAMAISGAEYDAAEKKIEEFGRPGGIGETLHKRLEQRREKEEQPGGRGHWLEEWWDEVAYMGYRDSVVINVSYYYGFDLPPSARTPLAQSTPDNTIPTPFALQRAASTLRSALLFRHRLLKGLIPPDAVKQGPLCMDSWRWMFDSCRIPHKPSDYALSFTPAERPMEVGIDGHFVVLRKNKVWKVPGTVKDARSGETRLLSTTELQSALSHIVQNTTLGSAVGNLTASDRDSWADDYAFLASISERNAGVLHDIHSAAFVLCLDDVSPDSSANPSKGPNGNGTSISTASGSDPISFSKYLWHGGLAGKTNQLGNRWMDKPVQFVLAPNGEMGILGEHSVMDGTPTTRMCDEVLDAVYSPSFDHGPSDTSAAITSIPLEFDVNEELQRRIDQAKKRSDELVSSQALTYHLTEYGKKDIKTYGIGPDGWTQMIIQLAYDRWCVKSGKPAGSRETGGTYEAATTRRFKKGRTEAIRVVSNEVREWLAAMRDEQSSPEERKGLLVAATKRHIKDAQDAGGAMGIDRHLLGLRMLVEDGDGEKALELFNDPLFQRSKKWVLSTSAIFSKHFHVYGWGEVVPDGFGVAYMTGYDDRLQFTITSRKEMDNEGFIREIARAAEDMRALFRTSASNAPLSRM